VGGAAGGEWVWFGLEWIGLVWFWLDWSGLVWFALVWCGVVVLDDYSKANASPLFSVPPTSSSFQSPPPPLSHDHPTQPTPTQPQPNGTHDTQLSDLLTGPSTAAATPDPPARIQCIKRLAAHLMRKVAAAGGGGAGGWRALRDVAQVGGCGVLFCVLICVAAVSWGLCVGRGDGWVGGCLGVLGELVGGLWRGRRVRLTF